MTITFSPTSYAFGDVSTGEENATVITVSNDGLVDITLTDPSSPFSMSASAAVVPAGGSVDITITFSPTAVTSSASSVSGDSASCSLTGTGVETSTTTTTTTGTHMLFLVPDFANGVFEVAENVADATVNTMTSYLRLGSFDYNDESTKAKELLDLIPQVTASTDPNASASTTAVTELNSGTAGAIFVDDVRTRPIDTGTGSNDLNADYGSYSETLTLADDPGHKLSKTQRQAESDRLYSRGGWRDHSDGNRVTTTYGDKVEVIRGNYKMIVMGRQDEPGEAMGWEASGSHCQDFAPGTMPGASFFLEWINDPRYYAPSFNDSGDVIKGKTSQKGVWMLVNTTENVYEYARYAGSFREERWGDVIETYVGSENPPSSGAWATDDDTGTDGHEPLSETRLPDRNYDLPTTDTSSTDRATPPWAQDNKGKIRSNPHIIERTWAERIDSTRGSSDTPVGFINEITYAKDLDEKIRVEGGVYTSFEAQNFTEEFEAGNKISERRIAPQIQTVTMAQGGSNWIAAPDNSDDETQWGDLSSITEYFYGNFFEIFIGGAESIKLGTFVDITFGLMELNIDMTAVARIQFEIAGLNKSVSMAVKSTEVFIGPRFEASTSLAVDANLSIGRTEIDMGKKSHVALAMFFG